MVPGYGAAPPGLRSVGEQAFVGDGGGHMELYESPRAVLPDGYARQERINRDAGHPEAQFLRLSMDR